jgi:hypothetical protein
MDPLPYDDEDDMIAEEMDFFDGDETGPPQGYDDGQEVAPPPMDDMEDEELEHASRQGIDTSNNADDDEMAEDGSTPSPTVPAYGSGEEDDDPASVRDTYSSARKRPIPQVLFKFERCV